MTAAQKTAAALSKKNAAEKEALKIAEANAYNAEIAKDKAGKKTAAAAKLANNKAEKLESTKPKAAEELKDEGTTDDEESNIEKMSKSNPNYGFCEEARRIGMPKSALPPQCQ